MTKKLIRLAFSIATLVIGAAAQTTVTTSGTTTSGTVPVFSGTSAVTNSPITVSNGNVGIGTPNPSALFSVGSSGSPSGISALQVSSSGAVTAYTYDGQVFFTAHEFGPNYAYNAGMFLAQTDNPAGAANYYYQGITAGTTNFIVRADGQAYFAGSLGIGTTSPGAALEVNGSVKLSSGSGAAITFADGTTQSTAFTGVLCGGDYAETVDVSGGRKNFEPGDVMVIDSDAPGKFKKSSQPYSTSVLGIYSTKPGAVGRRQSGPKNPDEVPMAMVGIVPTKVSAENGPIHPGDLLVSASLPGYAMKGTDRPHMLGAVIGKALGTLDAGTGVMEVGVTLQ